MEKGQKEVVILTCSKLDTLTKEDRALVAALKKRAVKVSIRVWDQVGAPPLCPTHDNDVVVVIRTIWDYQQKYETFLDRFAQFPQARIFGNKRYLLEVPEAVPSVLVSKGTSLKAALKAAASINWNTSELDIVAKPLVGSLGEGVFRVRKDDHNNRLASVLQHRDLILQPYVAGISAGELSCIFIDGEFSHAVKKIPPGNDFKVQGGSIKLVGRIDFPKDAMALAKSTHAWAVDHVGESLLFARIDLLPVGKGKWMVGEIEALDPELFLLHDESAIDRLAEAILKRFSW